MANFIANFFKRLFGKKDSKEMAEAEAPSITEQQQTSDKVDYVKELGAIICDYCEKSDFFSKPSFLITKNTNFKRDLHFAGIDVVLICVDFEKKFPVIIPSDHPFNHRLADDTDYTVEYLLSVYGLCDWKDEAAKPAQTNKTNSDSEINKDSGIGD